MKLTIKHDDIEADLSYGQLAIEKKRVFTVTITHFFYRRM